MIKATLNNNCEVFPPGKIEPPITNDDTINLIKQIQKLDSVHDFGGTRGNNLATDYLSKSKESGEPFAYDQMRLSFIQKYSFSNNNLLQNEIPDIPIQNYSNFAFPGSGQIPRIVDDIENFLLLSVINNAITNDGLKNNTNFLCVSSKENSDFTQTKKILSDFFYEYRDPGTENRINFIVDTPGHLTKVLKSNKKQDDFSYIFTQESAHDSAKGKPTTLSPIVIDEAYNGNGYCEAFSCPNGIGSSQSRSYVFNPSENGPGNFESNFTITFNGMNYLKSPKEFFYTNVTYAKNNSNKQNFDCPLNGLIHPTNVPQITKAISTLTKNSSLFLKQPDKNILTDHNVGFINNFYNAFNNPEKNYNYIPPNPELLDFNFTKKRAGDGLQARICQFVNKGAITLNCYKKYNFNQKARPVLAGLDIGELHEIHKLILVTIDRVLFSYCIKNNIPAIYSGRDFFIFFRPTLETQQSSIYMNKSSPINTSLPINTSSKVVPVKSLNKPISKITSKNQKGGYNMSDFFNEINGIPYIIFKLLPHVLQNSINSREITIQKSIVEQIINHYKNMPDEGLITQYGNGLCFLTVHVPIEDKYGVPLIDSNTIGDDSTDTIIHLGEYGIIKRKIDGYEIDLIKDKIFDSYFINLLNSTSSNIFTRSNVESFIRKNLSEGIISSIELGTSEIVKDLSEQITSSAVLSYFGPTEGKEISESKSELVGGSDNNLLDMYIDLLMNNSNKCEKNTLEITNFATLLSYFNIFTSYELGLCYDNDLYELHFIKINNLEVCKNTGLYVMFDLMLNDFLQQKNNICYGLLEYFINSGDNSQRYLSISTDLMEIINYVYCDDIRLDESLNNKIEEQINKQSIDINDPIFTSTKTYFETLFDRISKKQTEIQSYLDGTNSDAKVKDYIINNLSIYGFMNMSNNYMNQFSPVSSSLDSSEITQQSYSYPSSEERRQQIEEQKKRSQSKEYVEPTKSKLKPFQGVKMTVHDLPKDKRYLDGEEVMVSSSSSSSSQKRQRTGGKNKKTIKKRNKKNIKTRKNKQNIHKKNKLSRKFKKVKKHHKKTIKY